MTLLDEYPISREGQPPSGPDQGRKASGRLWGAVIVAMIIAAALVAFFVMRPSHGPGATDTDPAASAGKPASQARGPLGPEVEQQELPPLDLSDPMVRKLLSGLSSRPELATWLATNGLIRNFVASVDAVANGGTPAPQLRSLAPPRPFAVQQRGEAFVIDPRSYQRYDGIAATVAGLDPAGLARAYATLRPRLQEAYRELGYPEGNVDSAVERAITRLLNTPLVERGIAVQPAPVLYQYVDPRIEKLSSAQKQLIRMGPRNQRVIQDKLRELARALGIPT